MDPARKRKVLVVDDEPQVCSLLATALSDAGYEVTVSGDGRLVGVDVAATDLAFVDIFMPERDGLEVIEHLRDSAPDLAIVAMTGDPNYHGMHALDLARRMGADATLSKPFAMKAALSTCSELLGRRKKS
jgi:two-component system, chemotaxis family, chemotaxis protein CheY